MRGCPDEGMLRGHLDGELPRGRAEAVASHLSACVACAAAYREIEGGALMLAEALTPLTSMRVPAARLRERLDGAVGEPRSQARRDTGGFGPHAEPWLPAMLSSMSVPGGTPRALPGSPWPWSYPRIRRAAGRIPSSRGGRRAAQFIVRGLRPCAPKRRPGGGRTGAPRG